MGLTQIGIQQSEMGQETSQMDNGIQVEKHKMWAAWKKANWDVSLAEIPVKLLELRLQWLIVASSKKRMEEDEKTARK